MKLKPYFQIIALSFAIPVILFVLFLFIFNSYITIYIFEVKFAVENNPYIRYPEMLVCLISLPFIILMMKEKINEVCR